MRRDAPRLVLAGTSSGSGKTTMTMAILSALVERGEDVQAFKCGPDYIDPMFHSRITGRHAANVDLFFTDAERARALFARRSRALNVIEGVMGYYDGLAVDSDAASTWAVASALQAPTALVVDARGLSLSAAAIVRGFQTFRPESRVAAVLLNRVSPMVYPALKASIEDACGVSVLGYLPKMPEAALESRHLGLITAAEVDAWQDRMRVLTDQAMKSVDLDGLIRLMRTAPLLEAPEAEARPLGRVRVAVARDVAFCFAYQEDLDLLQDLGAELMFFSPLADSALPEADGLILSGGYPELHAEALEANAAMRESIRQAVEGGLPTIAECGGFMYLSKRIAGYNMVGALPGECANQNRLTRFGYVTVKAETDSLLFAVGDEIRGHEFHYWDTTDNGGDLLAVKPSGRQWRCGHTRSTLYAGYPHLSLISNPNAARRFVAKCLERKRDHETDGH